MTWAAVAAAVVGAGASVYGSQQAANAQRRAGGQNAEAAQRNLLVQLGLQEPYRQVGYQALNDLSALYGYQTPAYTPLNALAGGYGPGSTINVGGRKRGDGINPAGPLGLTSPVTNALGLGGEKRRFGGSINPTAGTVDVRSKKAKHDERATAYLRGEDVKLGGKFSRIRKEIDKLRAAGYVYDPNAATAAAQVPGQQNTQAGGLDRFWASPDYTFRRDEGMRGLEQSAAARGGAFSGDALKALTEFNGNLASGEFNNYRNNLFRLAGYGTGATDNAGGAIDDYTNDVQQSNETQGDARASGVLGTTNSIAGLMGDFARIYGNSMGSGNRAPYSASGPYSSGYQGLPQQQPSWTQNYLRGRR